MESQMCFVLSPYSAFTHGSFPSNYSRTWRRPSCFGRCTSLKRRRLSSATSSRHAQSLSMAREPVEEKIELPPFSSQDELTKQCDWLASEIRDWLDTEWDQGEPQPIHEEIGRRAAQIYSRHRMEGENDLVGILFALGSEMESMDFTKAFVGPWNVANKVSELLLRTRPGSVNSDISKYVSKLDPTAQSLRWTASAGNSVGNGEGSGQQEGDATTADNERNDVQTMPSLGDKFERYKFLSDLLDGSVSKSFVDIAVALAVGYQYDQESSVWDTSQVKDEYFKAYSSDLPDVLGDEQSAEWTPTLKHLYSQLGLEDDEDGRRQAELEIIVDAVHGVELSRIQRQDEDDHSFRKREIVAQWLHLQGGF